MYDSTIERPANSARYLGTRIIRCSTLDAPVDSVDKLDKWQSYVVTSPTALDRVKLARYLVIAVCRPYRCPRLRRNTDVRWLGQLVHCQDWPKKMSSLYKRQHWTGCCNTATTTTHQRIIGYQA